MYEDANLVSPEADWQGFVDDQVPELTQSTNNAITVGGFAAAEPSNTEFWFEALNMLMLQNKVEMLDSQGQAIFGDDADAQDALDFYLQFSGSNQSWSDDFNVDIAAFLEGKLATYMAPTWRLSDIVKYNELGSLGLDIGISAVPQLSDSAGAKANFASYWANVVNANSIYSEETWEFLNFLTQSEQLATLNRTMLNNSSTEIGILFPRIDMASQQSNDQYLGVYVDSLADARSWQMKDKTEIKSEFQTIFDDNATLSEVEEEVNKIL
jgi:ABC-type glycerol-3-phosphate transport system substrate-binding protein